MYRKIAIAGATAAVIVGSGTAALAVSGDTTAGTPAATVASVASPSTASARSARTFPLLRRIVHGQFVTRNKDGQFVTHDLIRGVVAAVSASAVDVKAADGTRQLYKVTSTTKIRIRTAGKGAPGKITDVHVGDTVLVAGTGTGVPTATHLVDVRK